MENDNSFITLNEFYERHPEFNGARDEVRNVAIAQDCSVDRFGTAWVDERCLMETLQQQVEREARNGIDSNHPAPKPAASRKRQRPI